MTTVEEVSEIIATMWEQLAESAHEISHAELIDGNLISCLKHAEFAEACYGRSTGEFGITDIKSGSLSGWKKDD